MGGTENIDSANVLPTGWYLRVWVTILCGALVGTGVGMTTDIPGPLAVLLGGAVTVALWFALRRLSRSYPLRKHGRIEVNVDSFIVYAGHSNDVVAEQPLASYESHSFRAGFGKYVPQRLTLTFNDGSCWRVTDLMGVGGLASFVSTLDELVADD